MLLSVAAPFFPFGSCPTRCSAGRERNDFQLSASRHDFPVPFSLLWFHQLPIVLEHQIRARVPELQRERTGIVESREVVRGETMAQSIFWPFFNPCCFPRGVEKFS